jgi:hypothetical protein
MTIGRLSGRVDRPKPAFPQEAATQFLSRGLGNTGAHIRQVIEKWTPLDAQAVRLRSVSAGQIADRVAS